MITEFKEITCIGNCTCSSEKRWIVYTEDLIEQLTLILGRDDESLDYWICDLIEKLEEQLNENSTISQKSHKKGSICEREE